MFHDVSRVVLCGRRNTFATLSEDALYFSWRAQLWRPPVSFCVVGATLQTCRVACFLRIALSALQVVTGANSVAGVAFCDMWWRLTEASHATSILRSIRKKSRRKTSILKLRSVKFEEVSQEVLLAGNARFDAPTCLVSSRWLSSAVAVYGGSCKTFPCWRFQRL